MKEIAKKHWDYIFFQDDEGAYILSVVCGTSAMYMVKIKLDDSETTQYEIEGLKFIDELAGKIRFSPDSYQDRTD